MSRNDAGMASHLALIAAFPLVLIVGSLLEQAISNQREQDVLRDSAVARTLSLNGVHDALAVLEGDAEFRGQYTRTMVGGQAWIEIDDWATDGIDNDDDGSVDGASEVDRVEVRSVGWVNATLDANGNPVDSAQREQSSITEVVLRRNNFDVQFDQTVYVDDPFSTLDLNGNAFLLSGVDQDPDGTPGPAADRAALGTPGDPSFLVSQVSAQQEDNILGAGGTPSIAMVDEEDLESWADTLSQMASVHFSGPSDDFTGALGEFDGMQELVIAHASGDLSLKGGVSGAGILVVDGDLSITGQFEWAGIIITRGSVTFRGGGGAKNLYGAVLCLGSVEATEVEISGSVELHYSSLALSTVAQQLSSYSVLAWTDR